MNSLDDKYSLLYKYVIDKNEPLNFFTLYHGEVRYINDFLQSPIKNFKSKDLLFKYFESLVDKQKLDQYINLIKNNIKRKEANLEELTEYLVADIISAAPKLKKILKGEKVYHEGDLVLTENIKDKILTEDQFNLLMLEEELANDIIVDNINQYKNNFIIYRDIRFDKNLLFNDYYEWLQTINLKLTNDINDAKKLFEIQKYLLKKEKEIVKSEVNIDKMAKIYNPTIKNRDVDIYDGLDLFNNIILNNTFYYMVYRTNDTDYYKIYDTINHTINFPTLSNDTMHIYSHNYDIDYNLNHNDLQIYYFNPKLDPTFDFLNIDINNVVDYNISGSFHFYNVQIDESKLLDLILNDNLLNLILFNSDNVKNRTKPYFNIKYVPFKSNHVISIKITQSFYNSEKVVDTTNGKITLKKDTPYLLVNFKNVYNVNVFVKLIELLINKVTIKDENRLNALLYNITHKAEKEKDINLIKLQNLAPDAFVEGYAGFCNKNKRPTPIDNKDIQSYINNKIKELKLTRNKAEEFKQYGVLDFETTTQVLHLVCDYDNDIYPYLKLTEKAQKLATLNKQQYEALPCCGSKPHKTKKEKKVTHLTNINVILDEGSTGEIRSNVNYFLSNYTLINTNFKRLGVPNDANSLLHCCCIATNDKKYSQASNKSYYVQQLKTDIINNININAARQELYDYTNIADNFINTDFLDPALYYRLLEEYFNVNIYVFGENIMNLPRYLLFHSRPVREYRKTILIYQHFNQCELIINNNTFMFDKNMAIYCHQFLQQLLTTLTFNNKIYKNLYYFANHLLYFNYKNVEQYIDSSGKMRALIFTLNNKKLSLLTVPSQPENLPTTNNIERCDIYTVLKVMTQEPVAVSKEGNLIVGLWYKIFDLEEGEYIPIIPVIYNIDKPIINEPALITNKPNTITTNYLEMKRLLNILLQVIYWLYMVGLYQFNEFGNVDEFFDNYVIIDEIDYNLLLTLPRRFPFFNKYNDYINYLPIVKNNKIVLTKDIYNSVKERVFYYDLMKQSIRNESVDIIPIVINNYYQYITDFNKIPQNLIFLTLNDLQLWLHQRQILYTTIINSSLPFLYQFDNGKIYIIQPSINLSHAITIIEEWIKNKINNVNITIKDLNIKPNIYKVNDEQKLILVQQGNTNYNVVDYIYRPNREGTYAAMLNLL